MATITGQKVQFTNTKTLAEALASTNPAAVNFTTDGHIVVNGKVFAEANPELAGKIRFYDIDLSLPIPEADSNEGAELRKLIADGITNERDNVHGLLFLARYDKEIVSLTKGSVVGDDFYFSFIVDGKFYAFRPSGGSNAHIQGMWNVPISLEGHNHTVANVSGLQSALDGKLATSGTAAKATADAQGNDIATTYARKTDIASAMHFRGITTTAITDNAATPSAGITIGSTAVTTFAAGDVVINGNDEFVYGSDSKWHKFGNASAYQTTAEADSLYVKKSTVAAKTTNLAYGTTSEVANIDGKAIKVAMPAAPGNGTVIIKQAGTQKGSFTLNQTGNATIELTDSNTTYAPVTPGTGTTAGTVTPATLKAIDDKATAANTALTWL